MSTKRKNFTAGPSAPKRLKMPTDAQIASGHGVYPTAGYYTIYERKFLPTGYVYIVDDVEAEVLELQQDISTRRSRRKKTIAVHTQKCNNIRQFFEEESSYEVISVPTLANNPAWQAWWNLQKNRWTPDDMIIIYYEGDAGDNGQHYQW